MKLTDNRTVFGLACELLGEGQTVTLRVRGQSMLPFFRSGSRVRVRPTAAGDLVCGHVVLGQTDAGTYVIHRIIRVDATTVTLLGDGNFKGTETIPRDRIYGVVDCSRLHLALARVWLWLRPVRRYPLWVLRRIFPQ